MTVESGARVDGISYLVCATQRSGSTLLCELLRATEVAGVPDEYFENLRQTGLARQPQQYFADPSVHDIAERLAPMVPGRPERPGEFEAWFRYVLQRATTGNGVFGAKMMWNYFDEFRLRMGELPGLGDLSSFNERLAVVFPRLKVIFIRRRDKVAQAVSLWKAIQTQQWRTESGSDADDREDERDAACRVRLPGHRAPTQRAAPVGCPLGGLVPRERGGSPFGSSTRSSPPPGPPP